jgi:hypothetical protein
MVSLYALRSTARSGSGLHPAMILAHSRACAFAEDAREVPTQPEAAASSPRCSYATRIAAASAFGTVNMPESMGRRLRPSKENDLT